MESVAAATGIDVSSEKLDVSVGGARPFTVPNTAQGCQELCARLPREGAVHLEASGGCERLVARTLRSAGFTVHVHDPLKARRLAQARGKKAKTDAVDAKELALGGGLLPRPQAKTKAREDLSDLSRTVSALQETIGEYKRRLRRPELDEDARKGLQEVVRLLQEQALALEKTFAERVRRSEEAERYRLALSVPGVGPKTARVLVCELPEDLPERTPAQICGFAGLAPLDDQSGKRTGRSRIGRGNRRLKAGLYMPAVCAVRSQPWARELYDRLRAKGRAHQQAMVAVMRRVLLRVVAVLKRKEPWQTEPPEKAEKP